MLTKLVHINFTFSTDPNFSWAYWIEFVTNTYPIMFIGNDGELYLLE